MSQDEYLLHGVRIINGDDVTIVVDNVITKFTLNVLAADFIWVALRNNTHRVWRKQLVSC